MITPENILLLIAAYLLGSIPSAVWIGKWFYGKDVREFGSGNAGATNTFRVLGKKAGTIVLIADILKGAAAVGLVQFSGLIDYSAEAVINLKLVLGLAAFLGHIFPVFAEFKGGKGVATLLGCAFALYWQPALMCALVFLLAFGLSGYVSLGSLAAALFYPVAVIVILQTEYSSLVLFSLLVSLLLLITHQKNIERLLTHTENRIFTPGRKKVA